MSRRRGPYCRGRRPYVGVRADHNSSYPTTALSDGLEFGNEESAASPSGTTPTPEEFAATTANHGPSPNLYRRLEGIWPHNPTDLSEVFPIAMVVRNVGASGAAENVSLEIVATNGVLIQNLADPTAQLGTIDAGEERRIDFTVAFDQAVVESLALSEQNSSFVLLYVTFVIRADRMTDVETTEEVAIYIGE